MGLETGMHCVADFVPRCDSVQPYGVFDAYTIHTRPREEGLRRSSYNANHPRAILDAAGFLVCPHVNTIVFLTFHMCCLKRAGISGNWLSHDDNRGCQALFGWRCMALEQAA